MSRDSDILGADAKSCAWKLALAEGGPNVQSWLVHQPGAHPMWSYWLVSVIHLRPIEGLPPARLTFPEATHEFLAAACDPGYPAPDPDDPSTLKLLTPVDLSHQVSGVTDAQVADILSAAVKMVMAGRLSFDSDYASSWKRILNSTVEHAVLGGHAKGSA